VTELESSICLACTANGERVLIVRARTFLNQIHLTSKVDLTQLLIVGQVIEFDIVKADPATAKGEYDWVAVLAWTGPRPDDSSLVFFSQQRTQSNKARVVAFEKPIDCQVRRAVAQVLPVDAEEGEGELVEIDSQRVST